MKHILELQSLHSNVASTEIDKRRSERLYQILMTINLLLPINRHNERLHENGVGPMKYLLFKPCNLAFNTTLKTCKCHHTNNIWELTKDSENNKSTLFMSNKTTLIQRNIKY